LPESIQPRGLATTGELYRAKLHPLPHSQNKENEKSSGKQFIRKIQKTKQVEKAPNGKSEKEKKE
jgi:hypothetical protein